MKPWQLNPIRICNVRWRRMGKEKKRQLYVAVAVAGVNAYYRYKFIFID